jgi:hypothetical protein
MARDVIPNVPNVRFGVIINAKRSQESLEIFIAILLAENAIPNVSFGVLINGERSQKSLEKILPTSLMYSLR